MMLSPHHTRRMAFTALQLVFVLGLILLGMALLVPAVQKVREAAARTQSTNNLKQMALAMHNFHDTMNQFPPAVGQAGNQQGPAHFHLLPYIEQAPLYQKADGASWKNGVYGTPVVVYLDPRDPSLPDMVYKNWLGTTNYPVNWMITKDGNVRLQNIPDGTSNTVMFAQRYQICNGEPTAWGYPSIHTWAPMFAYYNEGMFQSAPIQSKCDPTLPQSIGNLMQIALCDGSVRSVATTIRPTIWYYLCDPADGNPIPNEAFN